MTPDEARLEATTQQLTRAIKRLDRALNWVAFIFVLSLVNLLIWIWSVFWRA